MNYVDITYAESYFENRLHIGAWITASRDNRNSAIAMATQAIDRLEYLGTPASDENAFPREGETDVPEDIKKATCEIALALLDGIDPEIEYKNALVRSQRLGNVSVTYDSDIIPEHILAGIASLTGWRYLRPYLKEPGGIKICRVS